eukprot:TRINITY_DN19991_c0_g1_i1.p2 TRINITY_DN19991_c0_g1~~TRINITY_DN19991_c0_g1_i1.p2  ORF type:complete len:142 (-),score=24.31 TRINITY_DN19991_c0_g1_i1:65-490(-)
MNVFVTRLRPGDDVLKTLDDFIRARQIKAGFILTAVGSLTKATLRYANNSAATEHNGHFEIVSLVGTISLNQHHLHMSISDGNGVTVGGHLLGANTVYTTLELVIGDAAGYQFGLKHCPLSTWEELDVQPRSDQPAINQDE